VNKSYLSYAGLVFVQTSLPKFVLNQKIIRPKSRY